MVCPVKKIKIQMSFCLAALSWMVLAGVGVVYQARPPNRRGDTCIFNDTFDRWECCARVERDSSGTVRCAPDHPVRLLTPPSSSPATPVYQVTII